MTNVTTTCRDLSELLPVAELACRLLFQECYKAGIKNIFITETYRSQARQNYLYSQGRTRSGQIVTWTTSSRHTSRLAWDIACSSPASLYDVTTLNKVGAIAMKLGITWGGQPSWVKAGATDRPHFEVTKNWKVPNGYKIEGKVVVPSTSTGRVQLVISDTNNTTILDGMKGVANMVLNETGRQAIRNIIKKAVAEKIFTSPHKDADKYSDGELISYLAAYVDRKIK